MKIRDTSSPSLSSFHANRSHPNLVFDDLIDGLDTVIREWYEPRKVLAQSSRNNEKACAIIQQASSCSVTLPEKPEHLQDALRFQSEGFDPVNQRNDIISTEPALKLDTQPKKNDTTGPAWFDMPKTKLTPELRRDLELLSMRDALDNKRFYKKDKVSSKIPNYSQLGYIVEGTTEFYSARQTKKERRQTLVDEALAEEAVNKKHKRKYQQIATARMQEKALGRKMKRRRN